MTPYFADDWLDIHLGDCRDVLRELPAESVHCVVTSPPYWGLRDYGTATWIGGDEEGRNLRSVWTVATQPYPGAHFATFPQKLIEPCIKAGSAELGVILDPFAGSGTTGLVANRLSRRAILIDLSADYMTQITKRNAQAPLGLGA